MLSALRNQFGGHAVQKAERRPPSTRTPRRWWSSGSRATSRRRNCCLRSTTWHARDGSRSPRASWGLRGGNARSRAR